MVLVLVTNSHLSRPLLSLNFLELVLIYKNYMQHSSEAQTRTLIQPNFVPASLYLTPRLERYNNASYTEFLTNLYTV